MTVSNYDWVEGIDAENRNVHFLLTEPVNGLQYRVSIGWDAETGVQIQFTAHPPAPGLVEDEPEALLIDVAAHEINALLVTVLPPGSDTPDLDESYMMYSDPQITG